MAPIEPTAQQVADEFARFKVDAEALRTGGATPPAATPPAPPPSSSVVSDLSVVGKQPALSGAEAAAMRDQWIKSGADPARFYAAMKLDGITLPGPAIDPETAPLVAPARAEDYRLTFDPAYARSQSPEGLASVARDAAEWASAVGLSQPVANTIVEEVSRIGPAFASMGQAARQAWIEGERTIGIRHAGSPEKWESTQKLASDALAAGVKLNFENAMASTTAVLNSFLIVNLLANFQRSKK
jgi:hypothetical protein